MTETTDAGRAGSGRDRPRRDADGRLATIGDLLAVAGGGLVAGVVILLAFEAITTLARLSPFGHSSGWLATILPVWLFTEEFRAARYGALRVLVALLAGGFGVAFGLLAAGFANGLPPLVSGAVGAAVLTVGYAVVWFYGLRWLRHRIGAGESS